VAVVHSLLLPGGRRQYIHERLPGFLPKPQASRRDRPDCHALSDWNGNLEDDTTRGRRATTDARDSAMDRRRIGLSCSHSCGMDSSVSRLQDGIRKDI